MTCVTAVSTVHENVHQQAQEKRQPNEYAQDMGAVLGEQQDAGNRKKGEVRYGRIKSCLVTRSCVLRPYAWTWTLSLFDSTHPRTPPADQFACGGRDNACLTLTSFGVPSI
jgi:hypothetical protein